jgi:regulator of sirC expression with transglutaminase-like and TPR domain
MQMLVPTGSPAALSQRQRAALISLLVDEDPAIYRIIRGKILTYGNTASDWLRPELLSPDPVMRRRALEIVHHLARQNSDERFLAFCLNNGEELDLEVAVGLLAQTQYPDANVQAYQALFDAWAAELRERIDSPGQPELVLGILNNYLFEELGFSGNEHYNDNPENCYLNRVVDRRTGNPVTLCAIYLFLARRLQLPVAGIGLPGHFICRFQSSTKEIYIDVFSEGAFWTKADCIKHLIKTNHGLQEGYLAPVSSRRMLLRMCATIHQTCSNLQMTEEASRMQRYLVALAK